GLRQARRMVHGDGERRRGRTAPLSLRALRSLYRALQGHRGDCARLSPSGVFAADGDAYDRARRGRIAAGGGGAHALVCLGSDEENHRGSLVWRIRNSRYISCRHSRASGNSLALKVNGFRLAPGSAGLAVVTVVYATNLRRTMWKFGR